MRERGTLITGDSLHLLNVGFTFEILLISKMFNLYKYQGDIDDKDHKK